MTATFQDYLGAFVVENIVSIDYVMGVYYVEFEDGGKEQYTEAKLLSVCAY